MVDLKLISKDQFKYGEVPSNVTKVYLINEYIGYVFITEEKINRIFININKEYRSKGYASSTLRELLKYFNGELIFETNNPIVCRMLIKEGGINAANNNGVSRIVLYVKNKVDE